MRKILLTLITGGMLCSRAVQAGDFFFDFNTDPSVTSLFTVTGSGSWMPTGGVGAATNGADGYLMLTSTTSQGTRVIFSDFDAGSVVNGFDFECDLRIGNGSESPADGFSVNYCRADDPVLTGGDFARGQNCEANLPEEGTQTGIAIGFDAWDSGGSAPFCDAIAGIGSDVAAVTVRVDGILVLQYPCPTRNGTCTDASSIQTGPYDGAGWVDNLCWAHLKVTMTTDAKLNVWWKGTQILNNYQTTYYPSAGRLVFAGRTGGSWQNQQVDNIVIKTTAATLAQVGNATGLPDGFSIPVTDSGASTVDPATAAATAKLNGVAVTGLTLTKVGSVTTAAYRGFPTLLTPGSSNFVTLNLNDSNGNPITGDRPFVVPAYATLPVGDAVTGVDISKVGFRLMPWQSGTQPNNTTYTLEQLIGLHGANEADLTSCTNNGYINFDGLINFNITPASAAGGDAGNFQVGNGYPDSLFPGIPGVNGLNGSSAIDVVSYLKFPAAGLYTLGVNSDDGFLVTEGKNPKDWFALRLGEFSGGRGSSDTLFTFAVPAAGIYPVRLIWENGNGEAGNGANCEWFSIKDGVKYLVNDPDPTNTTGIQAYYGAPELPAYVAYVNPLGGATGVWPTNILAYLRDAGTTVIGNSVKLYLNGTQTSPIITSSGGTTTVSLTDNITSAAVAGLFLDGVNVAAVTWGDSAGTTHSNAWSFTVVPHPVLPGNLSTALGSGSDPGFRMRTFQANGTNISNGWRNMVQMANQALEGFYTPNISGTADMTNNGYCWLSGGVVDFAQNNIGAQGAAGNFSFNNLFPGLPGPDVTTITGSTTPMDNDAAEFKAYLEFPAPGVYYMGVNSDDGFRVTCAEGVTRKSMLTVTAPASIAGDMAAMCSINGVDGVTFGGPLPKTPIVSQAVVADPLLAGAPLNNAAAIAGKIAIVQRGTYGFIVKCKYAQDAGAVAVIVCNSQANAVYQPGIMGGADSSITIPCLFTTYADGTNLIAHATTDANSPLYLSIGDDASLAVGEFNGPKGSSDTLFPMIVSKAGVYPFRLVWQNGGGDANCEWFTIDITTGTKTLINDTGAPLKAYITRTGTAPTLTMTKVGGVVTITYTGTLQSCSTVNGTYQPVPGASNPYTVPTGSGPAMFYRSAN